MAERTLLVAGATGLLGRAVLEHFSRFADWHCLGISLRSPDIPGIVHLPADLTCRSDLDRHRGSLSSVTHLFYAALHERDDLVAGWQQDEQMQVNLDMFASLMEVLKDTAPRLEHVSLLQGTKAYGVHVEPIPVPAREDRPRHPHANFYWLQEDCLKASQAGASWHWTIWRPQAVFGLAAGSPMNLVAAIGAWASICKHLDRPCGYPGGVTGLTAATDARLLAQALHWAVGSPAARNQTFNITNGDVLFWPHLWPAVCSRFGIPGDSPEPGTFADRADELEEIWRHIAVRHRLRYPTLRELLGSSWQFLDRALGAGPAPSVLSTIKLRQAGFAPCLDTESSLLYWLDRMQGERLLPP